MRDTSTWRLYLAIFFDRKCQSETPTHHETHERAPVSEVEMAESIETHTGSMYE